MAGKPKSIQTPTPEQTIEPAYPHLTPSFIQEIGLALYESLQVSLADRKGLDEALDYWFDLSEMVIEPKQDPWPDSASLCMPITAGAMFDVEARLMAALFVKSPYLIQGTTPEAADKQEDVGRFYNSLFYTKEFARAHSDCVKLLIRDGTSYMYIPYSREISVDTVVEATPVLDEQNMPVMGANGQPRMKTVKQTREVCRFNGAKPQAFELRDVVLSPAAATGVDDASAVYLKVYLSENDLRDMVEAEIMWEDQVQRVLDFTQRGSDDLPNDEQGVGTYELSGLINVSGDEGTYDPQINGRSTRARGTMSFWLAFTRQYDLDADGNYELNVAWIHDQTYTCTGIGPSHYWHGRIPVVEYFFMRRPNRSLGRGVPELTRGLQEEGNALKNQRLDYGDLLLNPPRYHRRNVNVEDMANQWGLGADYEVDSPDDVGLLMANGYTVPVASFAEQAQIETAAKALVGVNIPGQATQPGQQKMPQKAAQAWTAQQNVIIDLIAMNIRWSMKEALEQIHWLTLQYGYEPTGVELPGEEPVPKWQGSTQINLPPAEVLALPYNLNVTGLTGGLDQTEEYQKVMTAYGLLRQDPLVSQDLGKWWYVVKMVLEQLGRPDIPEIIGTKEQAGELQQQMAAQAKQKEDREFALQMASHSKNPPPKPPGNGQPHPQPAPGGMNGAPH